MIRATSLRGRAVVDLDSATKLGQLDELILDPEDRRVAGLAMSQGPMLLGDRHERLLPASAVNAIGPDALTVHAGGAETLHDDHLAELPRLSAMTGRKVVTHSGKMLGVIADVLIAPEDGSIIGYALDGHGPVGRLEELFGNDRRDDDGDYIRAEADLRVGPDLVVVPDDAVVNSRSANRLLEEDGTERQAAPVRWLPTLRRPGSGSAWLGGGKPVASAEEDPDIDIPVQHVPAQPVQIHEARTRTVPVDGTPDV
jgi:sporulation protein YlmC with PRC-barrel domain